MSNRRELLSVQFRIFRVSLPCPGRRKSIIVPVVLYGCEAWSLRRNRELEGSFLKIIIGPKREDVTDDWRKLHNEELRYLHSSGDFITVIRGRNMRRALLLGNEIHEFPQSSAGNPEGKTRCVTYVST
jgi:hypothetical protein